MMWLPDWGSGPVQRKYVGELHLYALASEPIREDPGLSSSSARGRYCWHSESFNATPSRPFRRLPGNKEETVQWY